MQVHVLDLDGSVMSQPELLRRYAPTIYTLREWGPRIRLSCSHRAFERFEAALGTRPHPTVTLYGSGDFHHVTLALLHRITTPFNLLVLDKHPDWMRGVPVMHCGTWLYHAAQLPQVQRVYHVGGDLDFDNFYRWMAPWPDLVRGKIKVIPAIRRFKKGKWAHIPHAALRADPAAPATVGRVSDLIQEDCDDLARWPLYISLDKDVLTAHDAAVNWDSGFLRVPEVEAVLHAFLDASGENLIAMDIVGDWSQVEVRGAYRRILHWTEHPALAVDPADAASKNERLNERLIEFTVGRMRRQLVTVADSG